MSTCSSAIARPFARFAKARRGSAAVEFALVVIPFFLLTFGLVEVAMMGFAQSTLNNAVSETSREIRTGQLQTAGLTADEIEDILCERVNTLIVMQCLDRLYLDVDRFDSFTGARNQPGPISNGQFTPLAFQYNPGGPSDIVVVRAYYRWRVLTPMFESIFSNVAGGERILVSTMMFRNEPYQ